MPESTFIILPDKRRLSYSEYGDANGHPVFYFHGSPSSGLEPLIIGEDKFKEHGLRIIAVNRPGIGNSDFQSKRNIISFVTDILRLADHLQIEKFSVLGNSGGGPYAIACASFIPHRLISAVVVSGGWQMNLPAIKKQLKYPYSIFWKIAGRLPFLLPFLLKSMKSSGKENNEKELSQAKKMMAPQDYELICNEKRANALNDALNMALSNTKGVIYDLKLYLRDMNISTSQIDFPIEFYHGTADRNIPIQYAREIAGLIPSSVFHVCENEAHLSTLCNRFDAIADSIMKNSSIFSKNKIA